MQIQKKNHVLSDATPRPHPPCILTIAGSDSSGGAGIQADLKTFTVLRCYGASVLTAITAQNTQGVQDIAPLPEPFVARQLQSVLEDLPVAAAKTGMLFSAPLIRVLAGQLATKTFPLVVDPVCVSKSGHSLLLPEAVETLKSVLLPLADLVTPNRPEAELLTGMDIVGEEDVPRALELMLNLGCKAVLLKGGHFEGEKLVDWLAVKDRPIRKFEHARLASRHTHGTGCTLSAAIAAGLGQGLEMEQAVEQAVDYLHAAIRTAYPMGRGVGPVNHLHPWLDPAQ
ncbi:hydroxymethylpyrimidine/phosphomethylpyrimidine kinase [Desulfonatronum thiosulfatophilum]|uniref:hydroxymethylpyrimidine kinase n=1 Tax=Desulfonatronum thiosulfatophilum TaxID=617002 RepID=A0A1G6E9Z6_9BACT|nr:bifunctional hydroxymethylpyrimidine kinase/phosphomethylpyrimidine kinase [Desulfonatronum thiosulfatophilum]SDB54218.1 hydroxymethylpyrimidine/phosphomethylpyrimidine kinase [Desulfonatronum thiosulfatophilum]